MLAGERSDPLVNSRNRKVGVNWSSASNAGHRLLDGNLDALRRAVERAERPAPGEEHV
jgi:hypothetical protein